MRPGDYRPDPTLEIRDPKDLPDAVVEERSRDYRHRPCPKCGRSCYRDARGERYLYDMGDLRSGRPRRLHVRYSIHRCEPCKMYFSVDMSDLAPRGAHYTNRVIDAAVRVVVEDRLPYREASWHLWRDHRVFVPWGTIEEWVDASGGKRGRTHRQRVPRLGD